LKVILVYVLVLILGSTFFKLKWLENITFAFVVLLPMKAIVHPNDYIFYRISPDDLSVAGFLIAYYFFANYRLIKFRKIDESKKYTFYFIVILIFCLNYYINIKANYWVGTDATGLRPEEVQAFQIIRDLIIIYSIILIFKLIYDERMYWAIEKGLLFGTAIIALSMSFSDYFSIIGLHSGFAVHGRTSGFLNDNPNVAGAYLSIFIGYFIGRIENYNSNIINLKYYIIVLFIAIIGIFATASRTSLIALFFVFSYFLFKNSFVGNIRQKVVGLFLIFALLIAFIEFGSMMEDRVNTAMSSEGETLQTRFLHWALYFEDLMYNKDYLIYGNTKPIQHWGDVHNLYLYLTWNAGLIYLLIFIFLIRKISKSTRFNRNFYFKIDILYLIIPLIVSGFTSSHIIRINYLLAFALASGLPNVAYFLNNKSNIEQK